MTHEPHPAVKALTTTAQPPPLSPVVTWHCPACHRAFRIAHVLALDFAARRALCPACESARREPLQGMGGAR